jgi:hypothetical protein
VTAARAWGRRIGATVPAVAALAALAALSQAPYAHQRADTAELRLAWRARSARIDACRRRTADELARLPVHMRQELVCERRVAPYRLTVTLDDSAIVDRAVVAAGARADRPLYVFEEIPLEPGTYALRVAFTRQDDPAADTAAADPRAAPRRLTLDTTVMVPAGRAVLVTYDENTRRLHLVTRH